MALEDLLLKLPRHLVSQIKEEADDRPIFNSADSSTAGGLERNRRVYSDLSSFLSDSQFDRLVDPTNKAAAFVVVDKAIEDADVCRRARQEAEYLRSAGRFRQASFGGGSSKSVDTRTRSDEIVWIRQQDLSELPAFTQIVSLFEEIGVAIDKGFARLGENLEVQQTELQLSVYPKGTAGYAAHKDTGSVSGADRFLTVILYLNENWKPECGGCLRLHLDACRVDISPCLGKLVLFRSEQLEHSVLPVACADRFAVTCWFSVRPRVAGQSGS
ncbi:oxidoreductase, 2OG-Fe(II) oxygenase family protein [Toxoplasma gondii MAS]|uniref:Oxidoreductase, 2OG-Fe(II) oxygenase family protein n=2 Tax=Toxoplasma gondii TaxID=5811 RepID=A0A086QXF2_TOXGO|nr:oxidoreductase, 2OG-Fe(II) oxygenase family protein [Toxoplasma gondii MAS]RQX75735.1 oxidoreductase, 2OG-Fe(II) oxygenase family protein [Toxoplasma gondii CAST]